MSTGNTDQLTAAYSGRSEQYEASAAFKKDAYFGSMDAYEEMYKRSIEDPEGFWEEQAKRIDWFEPFHTVKNVSYASSDLSIRWFEGGKLNASYNSIDRHLAKRGKQTAMIFEPDDPNDPVQHITYMEMHEKVCTFANCVKKTWGQEGRPSNHLSSHDPRGGVCDASLCSNRSDILCCFCGVFS